MAETNIKSKMIITSLLVGILPLLIVGALVMTVIRSELVDGVSKNLQISANSKILALSDYFDTIRGRTLDFSSDEFIRDSLKSIENGTAANGTSDALGSYLLRNKMPLDSSIAGILILDNDGKVVASTDPSEIGKDESRDPYYSSNIGEVNINPPNHVHFGLSDYFVVVDPLTDKDSGARLGTLVNVFRKTTVLRTLSGGEAGSLNVTGYSTLENYLVDSNGTVFADPFINASYGSMQIDTLPIQSCRINGSAITDVYDNYAGTQVLGVSSCLNQGLVFVSEVGYSEAFQPVDHTIFLIGFVLVFFMMTTTLISLIVSNSITKPIIELTEAIERISEGERDVEIRDSLKEQNDETGRLARAFDRTLVSLKLAMKQTAPELKIESDELRKALEAKEKTGRALRESEERYRRLVELSPDAIVVHDGELISYANASALKLAGASDANDLVGKPLIGFVHPDNRKAVKQRIEIMKKGKAVPAYEEKFIRIDGSLIDVEVTGAPIVYEGKRGIQLIIRDISRRKIAEDELRESEEKLALIFENVEDAIVLLDKSGELKSINTKLTKMTGYTEKDLLGKSITELKMFTPESMKKMADSFAKRLQGIPVVPYEVVARTKDGRDIIAEIKGSQLIEGSMVTGVVLVITDITEKKAADEELRKRDEMFRMLSEATSEGIAIHDKVSILEANAAFAKMFGYKHDEVIGMSTLDFFAKEAKENVFKNMERGYQKPYETIGIRKDGTKFRVIINAREQMFGDKTIRIASVRTVE